MGRNRKAYRENKKRKNYESKIASGLIDRNNCFGKTDLTPYNAVRLISEKYSESDIKYN